MGKILVVDDEQGMREFLSIILQKEGHHVITASNGSVALEYLSHNVFDIVLTDIKMPGISGLDILKQTGEHHPDTIVIMITAFASTETAIEAMKQGAYDYISKPFKVEEIKLIVRNALEKRKLRQENMALKRKIQEWTTSGLIGGIVGKSPAILAIIELIAKIADSPSTVLITGESGTGKELVARAIHNYSKRKNKPFIAINCSAIPEGLLESELFGHVKGAFTGAIMNKEGLFEAAHEGTLFLDEIGDIPLSFQAKLLRVLEDKKVKRVGSNQEVCIDVRIIAATNKDLKRAISEGTFREDLFYRLDVIPIKVPPLRERKEDIPLLVKHFISHFSRVLGREIRGASKEAMEKLIKHPWKGNVRELENVIERAITLGRGPVIELQHIEESLSRSINSKIPLPSMDIPPEGVNLDDILATLEKDFLIKALHKARGIKKDAAKLLGLDFRSFRYRLSKYNISKDDDDQDP